ncbi:antibiotic biosynthesis monooxygenase [Paenibacillus mendelii]|uniref:Antibiotic biosynthesis monooxygenase n=1 Tax=Paenibacillus mendelii TaxID=206163 RepID=A0ABV6JDS0_9BACL|nr:antibiotic biosynthesis monooxygenase [Paenibacillus mendelii]MCQ6563616.1 antibiotic biosynthesis monooxygenase [Paenibacillus mendelii]
MIIVMNTIKVKKGHGEEVAQRFQRSKGVQLQPGFVRMEVLFTEGLEENDELKVCTTWEDKASFEAWVNSDNFKQAHAQRAASDPGGPQGAGHGASTGAPQGESVMLGAKMTTHTVLMTRLAGEDV